MDRLLPFCCFPLHSDNVELHTGTRLDCIEPAINFELVQQMVGRKHRLLLILSRVEAHALDACQLLSVFISL